MSVATSTAIGLGIAAATTATGAYVASKASNNATAATSAATGAALDFSKQQYADLQARLAPYNAAGQTASQRMSALLAQSPYARQAAPPAAAAPPQQPGPAAPPPGAQVVTLRAPDGSTKQFQQGDPAIAQATAAGAQAVG